MSRVVGSSLVKELAFIRQGMSMKLRINTKKEVYLIPFQTNSTMHPCTRLVISTSMTKWSLFQLTETVMATILSYSCQMLLCQGDLGMLHSWRWGSRTNECWLMTKMPMPPAFFWHMSRSIERMHPKTAVDKIGRKPWQRSTSSMKLQILDAGSIVASSKARYFRAKWSTNIHLRLIWRWKDTMQDSLKKKSISRKMSISTRRLRQWPNYRQFSCCLLIHPSSYMSSTKFSQECLLQRGVRRKSLLETARADCRCTSHSLVMAPVKDLNSTRSWNVPALSQYSLNMRCFMVTTNGLTPY